MDRKQLRQKPRALTTRTKKLSGQFFCPDKKGIYHQVEFCQGKKPQGESAGKQKNAEEAVRMGHYYPEGGEEGRILEVGE